VRRAHWARIASEIMRRENLTWDEAKAAYRTLTAVSKAERNRPASLSYARRARDVVRQAANAARMERVRPERIERPRPRVRITDRESFHPRPTSPPEGYPVIRGRIHRTVDMTRAEQAFIDQGLLGVLDSAEYEAAADVLNTLPDWALRDLAGWMNAMIENVSHNQETTGTARLSEGVIEGFQEFVNTLKDEYGLEEVHPVFNLINLVYK